MPLLPPPTDLEATALFDQAQSVESIYFSEPAGKLSFEVFVKKFMGIPSDEKNIADAVTSLKAFFQVAETILEDRDYMAGSSFTLVDIYYIPLAERLFGCGYGELFTSQKNVKAWWTRCTERPAIKKTLEGNREMMLKLRKK